MDRVKLLFLVFFGSVAAGATAAGPARSVLPKSPVLDAIEPGRWELRGAGSDPVTLCIGDVQALLQVRHGSIACVWYTVANQPRLLTISYRCPHAGYGMTTIKLETRRLIQLESQGTADNQPFALTYEGRRTGDCAATAAPRAVSIR